MYIVIEIQKNNEGIISPLIYAFNTKSEAESKYYNILSYAAISDLPKHGALLLYEEILFKSEIYKHEIEPTE